MTSLTKETSQPRLPPAAVALFFYGLLLFLFSPIRTPYYIYDEGFATFNAVRLLSGELPYRDFWAIYPPGQLYVLAGVYEIFGISLLVSRVYDTLVRFGLVVVFYLAARKISSRWLAYAGTLGAALMMASVGFYAYAVYPALGLGLFALWAALRYVESDRRRWLALSGGIAGLAGFFRWDIGLYAAFGIAGALALRGFVSRRVEEDGFFSSIWAGLITALPMLGTTLVVMGALYGVVSLGSGLGNVWGQVVAFPALHLREVRWLAYPGLLPAALPVLSDWWQFYGPWMDWLRFYLPLAVFGVAAVSIAGILVAGRRRLDGSLFGVAAAGLFGLLAFSQALSRYDFIHALPAGLLSLLVFLGLAARNGRPPGRRLLGWASLLLLPGALAVYFASPLNAVFRTLDQVPPWNCYSDLERASCVLLSENQQRAVAYIQARTAPDEPIFVGNTHHDYVFVSDVGFYFLAGRPSATRYSELHPGVATTPAVQAEMIAELESGQVGYLVLVDIPKSGEPNASARSSGVTDLDAYIASHYARAVRFGEYAVWRRLDR